MNAPPDVKRLAPVLSGNREDDLTSRESARRNLAAVLAETRNLPRGQAVTRVWETCYQDRPRSWVNRHLTEITERIACEDRREVITYTDPVGNFASHRADHPGCTCAWCITNTTKQTSGPGERSAKNNTETAA